MINTKSVAFKIVLYTTLCVMIAGISSNLYLYMYLQKKILEKVDAIDALYLDTIRSQISTRLQSGFDLGISCASDLDVSAALSSSGTENLERWSTFLSVQKVLNAYLNSYLNPYVEKLVLFNHGVTIQAYTRQVGRISDRYAVMASPLYKDKVTMEYRCVPSITPYAGDVLAMLVPVFNNSGYAADSYLYMELNLSIFTDVLLPYSTANTVFIAADNGRIITHTPLAIDPGQLVKLRNGDTISPDGHSSYRVSARELGYPGFTVYNLIDVTNLSLDNKKMLYTLVVVLASVVFVSMGILIIMSNFITRPIRRLIAHIKRISANEIVFDPTIESSDEIGEIGRVINEMSLSINNLLKESEEMHEQRKNIEIALLQSQVNPHFLYNTLDSIHWMAVIQKSPGICNITRSLSNLLRNIAKGTQDKITLSEELALLDDYVAIQSIRYMETFEFINNVPAALLDYRVIKLTLQPLVENAIFHGIEPTGEFGTITVDAREDGDDLLISVTDSGVGIEPEQLDALLVSTGGKGKGSLNGIGISNVHNRLRLVYGKRYGLTLTSEVGSFTKVTVRIPKERGDETDV